MADDALAQVSVFLCTFVLVQKCQYLYFCANVSGDEMDDDALAQVSVFVLLY
jgi:hypothetical protein